MPQPPVDYDGLAEDLAALAYPMRLELLDILRFPHTLNDIRIAPHRVEPGGNPERPAAKQTVQAHLDKLEDVGLVRSEPTVQAGKRVHSYVVAPQKLYAVTEDLRLLSLMYAGRGAAADATGTLAQPAHAAPVRGPRLVLVHGVYEGRAYPLDAKSRKESGWTIGRRADASVPLDYDPYVSVLNAEIVERDGAFLLRDEPASKNGTRLNWDDLPRGGERALESGDVIGVGRSLLVFRAS